MLTTLIGLIIVLFPVAIVMAIIREIAPDAFVSKWLRVAVLCILLIVIVGWLFGGAGVQLPPHWK
jgi:hypothetical protein